jgi:RNA 3'-terminal phosphate cyclase (ATP)
MTVLLIDGSHGEGGGQILRTALSLAALTGRAMRIERIRAGRRRPGLMPQHLTAVRAVAALCAARVRGDSLESTVLDFEPGAPPQAGHYVFDVAAAKPGGSAGATGLVVQAVLLPLALADGASTVVVKGGTHVATSPPADYLAQVWLPMLGRMGVDAKLTTGRVGWFPAGGGEVTVELSGRARDLAGTLKPLGARDRGALRSVRGRAIASRLPEHVPHRMVERANARLAELGITADLHAEIVPATSTGAGLFLHAEFDRAIGGYTGFGRRGVSAEAAADEAVDAFLSHFRSRAALERHLADQLLLPAALASGLSAFTVERVTTHLETNAWAIERFGIARIHLVRRTDGSGDVGVEPARWQPAR